MRCQRPFSPGGSFFFTAVTAQRRSLFASADAVNVLRTAFRAVRANHSFEVDVIVVLPDHLHCISTLPQGDADFATRWRLIKTWFSKHSDQTLRAEPNRARAAKREQALWQHRYWEHALRDEVDVIRHVEYVHFNPVKHGLVASAMEWPYSSFRRYVAAGVYPAEWGQGTIDFEGVGCEGWNRIVGLRCANPTYDNGEHDMLGMKPYLGFGVFQRIREYEHFKCVRVAFDAIEWDSRVDLDP